ncbi:MAG: type II toxin-antitoxin system HicA family toxin [Ktedonobacteraceae bacterium]|nr:type II toxin-antitoxin system HicA family toxin [Ktedonobacteraceae bacterium]
MKIRRLKIILRQRGYTCRSGKGSHRIWVHPSRPEQRIVLAGADGKEAHPYQVAQVCKKHRSRSAFPWNSVR